MTAITVTISIKRINNKPTGAVHTNQHGGVAQRGVESARNRLEVHARSHTPLTAEEEVVVVLCFTGLHYTADVVL